jgi:hypothetical protein
MGAWSHESFGNDAACDWAAELAESGDLELIASTLDTVVANGDKYLETPEASRAIAAAEAVARLQGHFGTRDGHSEPVDAWVGRVKLVPPESLVRTARQVLERILVAPSELLEIWGEAEDGDAWFEAVKDLKGRIRA